MQEQQWQTVSREMDNLRLLKQCKNVVQLLDVRNLRVPLRQQQHQLNLVFEFCPFELQRIISNKRIEFTLPDIKALLFQLFEGLTFIHHKKVHHSKSSSDFVFYFFFFSFRQLKCIICVFTDFTS